MRGSLCVVGISGLRLRWRLDGSAGLGWASWAELGSGDAASQDVAERCGIGF